jgi:hypothetical protein
MKNMDYTLSPPSSGSTQSITPVKRASRYEASAPSQVMSEGDIIDGKFKSKHTGVLSAIKYLTKV